MNETIKLSKPILGINNVAADTDLPDGAVREAINVDIDRNGNILSRKGYTKIYHGTGIHSLYKRYFVENSQLKYLENDNTATVIDTEINLNSYIAWETIHGSIYYSDGKNNKIIGSGEWGINQPNSNPIMSETGGKLKAGRYQVGICFINSETGERGGSKKPSIISVGIDSGILLSNIPVSPEGYDTEIYVSTQNGIELYRNGTVPNGTTSYTIIDSKKSTITLNTKLLSPMPGGHIIRHFKARVYVARDNALWFSCAFRYGLKRTKKDFFQFPSRITVVQAVEDGIYVVADKTYFLAGTDPKTMQQRIVSKHTAIEGTGKTMGGETFAKDDEPGAGLYVGYWFSNAGAVVGTSGGVIKELTDDSVAIPTDLEYGTTTYKKKDGIKQMITNFTNNGNGSSFAFSAQATGTIIRNGIIVP